MKLSREQAQAFIDSLFPAGEYCYLHNPTRTYFSALIGDVPSSRPYLDSDPNQVRLRELADILRQIASHIEVSGESAEKVASPTKAANNALFQKGAEEMQERARLLESALEFYANPAVYAPHPHGPAFDRRDISYKAKNALAEYRAAPPSPETDSD